MTEELKQWLDRAYDKVEAASRRNVKVFIVFHSQEDDPYSDAVATNMTAEEITGTAAYYRQPGCTEDRG